MTIAANADLNNDSLRDTGNLDTGSANLSTGNLDTGSANLNTGNISNPNESPTSFPVAEGRDIAAILDPAPITVIGAHSEDGRVGFATVLWVTPISHKPAMLAFALREKSHTMGIIRKTGYFSMSTFPADKESVRIIETCGNNSGHKLDKGAEIAHSLLEAIPGAGSEMTALAYGKEYGKEYDEAYGKAYDEEYGKAYGKECDTDPASTTPLLPVPNHALAWELCEVASIQEAGDHLLVIGRVLKAGSWGSRDEKGRLAPTETLLCIQHGAFAPVGKKI